MNRMLPLFVLLLSLIASVVEGTVYLPHHNVSYASTPALFGGEFEDETLSSALITTFADEPLLCEEPSEESVQTTILDFPPQEFPTAILVQRGECTFHQKAEIASKYPGVEYVIVYDSEKGQPLVPMASEFTTDISLLFVSYETGNEIRQFIMEARAEQAMPSEIDDVTNSTNSTDAVIGIRIDMDSISPPLPAPSMKLNVAGYILAALTGFFAFLIFFGCVLLAAQAGIISMHPDGRGRIVLFAGRRAGQGGATSGNTALANGLLTESQLATITEEKFDAKKENSHAGEEGTTLNDDESNSACCCSICLEDFEDQEVIRKLPCEHKYHGECLVPWLTERSGTCPLCKFDVLEHIMRGDEENNTGDDTKQSASTNNPTPSRRSLWSRLVGGYNNVRITSSSDEEDNGEESTSTTIRQSQSTENTIPVETSSSRSESSQNRTLDTTIDDLELAEESLDDIELAGSLSPPAENQNT